MEKVKDLFKKVAENKKAVITALVAVPTFLALFNVEVDPKVWDTVVQVVSGILELGQ